MLLSLIVSIRTAHTMKNFQHLVNSELTKSIENYDRLSAFVYELMHLDKEKHNVWAIAKRQKLTLMTDNPYLATQLSYEQENILAALNRNFLMQLKTTKVKIVPPSSTTKKKKQDLYTVGAKAGETLKNIASEIEDIELRNSLLKLANQDK